MAKKFNDNGVGPGSNVVHANFGVTLDQFVTENAPDILESLPCMKSVPAVEYYSRLFEKEKHHESKRHGKDGAVLWPYAVRIIYLARKFRTFSDQHKKLVIDARVEKIFWRGDEPNNFDTIITETILYRDLTDDEKKNYQRKIMAVAKSMKARHAMF